MTDIPIPTSPMTEDLTIYWHGVAAFCSGIARDDNPYEDRTSFDRADWVNGWDDASNNKSKAQEAFWNAIHDVGSPAWVRPANISAYGPVDGMNGQHPQGSYFRITAERRNEQRHEYLISRGLASELHEQLGVLLGSHLPTRAVLDVLSERRRQVRTEGWTPDHDDKHSTGEMASAAACYATQGRYHFPEPGKPGPNWPWGPAWWKPETYRRNLIKAGALILAEIERLDRQEAKHA